VWLYTTRHLNWMQDSFICCQLLALMHAEGSHGTRCRTVDAASSNSMYGITGVKTTQEGD